MVRDEDPARDKVEAPVPLLIRRVPEKDTESRPGSQLVRSGGYGVRVASTPEDSEVIVPRGTEKRVVWCGSWAGSGRKTVKEIGGSVKTLSPEVSRK
jgi:hypothetical protein